MMKVPIARRMKAFEIANKYLCDGESPYKSQEDFDDMIEESNLPEILRWLRSRNE